MTLPLGPIDHVAFQVGDLDRMVAFFGQVLGARTVRPALRLDGRDAVQQVRVGSFALSLHQADNGISLAAPAARPGSLDICVRWHGPIESAVAHLDALGIVLTEGPVPRMSATGEPGQSVYFRDPEGNLFELLSTAPGETSTVSLQTNEDREAR